MGVPHARRCGCRRNVSGTDAVYRATWASLLAIYRHNAAVAAGPDPDGDRIGHGRVPADGGRLRRGCPVTESARQMAAACRFYFDPPHRLNWDAAIERQRVLKYDGGRQALP